MVPALVAPAACDPLLAELGLDAAIGPVPGHGWVPLDVLTRDAGRVRGAMAACGQPLGITHDEKLTGLWLVADVTATLASPALAAILGDELAVRIRREDVYVPEPAVWRPSAVRFVREPGATAVASGGDPAELAAALASALEPLVAAISEVTRRGQHSLWGAASDTIVGAFREVGHHLGYPTEARQLADAVLAASDRFLSPIRWHTVAWSGGVKDTRIRAICCLRYRAPRGVLCFTCPRLSDDERRQQLEERAGS